MSGKGLLALVVVFLALLSIVLWVDRPKDEKPEVTKNLGTILPSSLDSVTAIETEGLSAPLRIERAEDPAAWRLVLPLESEADPREVKSLYDGLVSVPINRVVEEQGANLAQFGLEPPEGQIKVFPSSGAEPVRIAVGRASPVGDGRYAVDGTGRVLLVGGAIRQALERAATSIRERRLLPVEADAVAKLSVVRGPETLTLERKDGDWRLSSPIEDRADSSAADALVRAAVGLTALQFAHDAQLRQGPNGVADPEVTIRVETKDGKVLGASIEKHGPDGQRGAGRVGGDFMCFVDATAVSEVTREVSDLRDRKVVRAEPGDVLELVVRHRDAQPELLAKRDGGQDPWSVREGDGPAQEAAPRVIDDLLSRLTWLRADSFETTTGNPDGTSQSVVLSGKDGELGRLDFFEAPPGAALESAAERRVLVRSSWRPGLLLGVRVEALGTLPGKLADLTEPAAATSPAPAGS